MGAQAPAIVLIETDDITLDLYQRELSKSFTVFGFTELNDALETVEQKSIQAVVIEPEVNGGKGWEFIRNLGAESRGTPPVIVCSTRDASDTKTIAGVI